jgi:N-acetylglucosaminyldiphosphoundecaprenol N-acetyl-beta-D-mannosaminyltransferase
MAAMRGCPGGEAFTPKKRGQEGKRQGKRRKKSVKETEESKAHILGYAITLESAEEVAAAALRVMDAGGRSWFACANPHSLVVAEKSPDFAAALHAAGTLVPDGAGILLASRILGAGIRRRVTGMDVFLAVHRALQERGGGGVFLLGSTEETLRAVAQRLGRDFPAVRVAGALSPPFAERFSEAEESAMVEAVNASEAAVLWVAMTAPKQEVWLARAWPRLTVGFGGAVGAVFDFYAGRVPRSRPVFQRLGLEWLPRLLREPRRLWRRTLVSAPVFLWRVMRERTKGGG